jgi:predicted MFS family arabinose efflux permease
LTSANVVCIFMESCATLAGPVLAGALLVWSGADTVFAAAALMSLVAATLFLRLRYDAPRSTEPAPRRRIVRDTLDGLRTVGRHRELRWLFGIGFAQTYTRGALNVFTVVIAFQLLGIGEPGVAALSAAVGIGGIIGSLGVSLLVGSRHLGLWLIVALVLWGAPIAVIGIAPEALVAYALVAVVGLANSIIDVPLFTLPVRLVRDSVLSRVVRRVREHHHDRSRAWIRHDSPGDRSLEPPRRHDRDGPAATDRRRRRVATARGP